MVTDAQITPEIQPTPRHHHEPLLAPWWHTAILIILLLTVSINGTRASQPVVGEHKLAQYIWTMGLEWTLVGYIWLGVRKRIRMRDLIGGRWATLEDFFLDIIYAGVFWFAADARARPLRQGHAPGSSRQDRKHAQANQLSWLRVQISSSRSGSVSVGRPASARKSSFADTCNGSLPPWADRPSSA